MVKKILLLLVVIGGIVGAVSFARMRSQAKVKPEILTAKVERGSVISTVTATGSLQPLTTVDIRSKAGGRVDLLAVEVGTVVKTGQLIAKIDPTDTLANVRTATADMSASRARIRQAQDNLSMQKEQSNAQVRQAEQALQSARVRLAQALKQAKAQPKLTASSIAQAQANLHSAREALHQLEQATIPQTRASAQSTYDQAVANLKGAEESLQQLKSASQPQQVAQAQAAYDQARANREIAELEYGRQKDLRAKGFISQSALDTARNRLDLAEASLTTAKAKWDTLKAEQSADLQAAVLRVDQMRAAHAAAERRLKTLDAELAAQTAAAKARVTQAEAQLENARANTIQDDLRQDDVTAARAAVEQAEASLAAAKANLLQIQVRAADIETAKAQAASSEARLQNAHTQYEQTVITAPRDGIVLQKYVEQGTIITSGTSAVAQGTNLVQLGDLSRMFVEVLVDEADIGAVEVDQKVDITIDAYPAELFEGKVTVINPQAETVQNVTTVKVKVEVDNPDARLKPGMNASCEFIVARADDVLFVPSEAVQEGDGGKTTVTVLAGEEQQVREVETGLTGGDSTEIRSGLKEGEEVITAIIDLQARPSEGGRGGGGGGRMGNRGAMGGMPRGAGGGGGGRR